MALVPRYSLYMLSSTCWLKRGALRFPFLSKTPLFLESGIATANLALSAAVAGGLNDMIGVYGAALAMISGSCHNFCASCWRARAMGSQLDGLVLSPNVRPVCMIRVLWDRALCIATRLGLYLILGKAHCASSSPVWRSCWGYEIARFQCQMQNWWNESAKWRVGSFVLLVQSLMACAPDHGRKLLSETGRGFRP